MYIVIYIYMYSHVIMKTMCPPSYHHNGFVATHALGQLMRQCGNGFVATYVHELPQSKAIVVITGRANCFHDYMYIMHILFL